jgi:hypothetical protein
MKIVAALVMIMFFAACRDKTQTVSIPHKGTGKVVIDTFPFRDLRDFPQIGNETNVDSLIKKLIRADCVYESAIGAGGAYIEEYACYERLTQLLNDEEIFALTNHYNPNIRMYAFKALKYKKSNYLKDVKNKLNKDTAMGCWFSGCIQLSLTVSDFVRID